MSQDNEQYRAGFEAWASKSAPGHQVAYLANGEYADYATQCAWVAWIASKREASTEPSDWRERAARACYAERVDADETKAPEDAAYNQAIENCMDAIRNLDSGNAGALTDDAKESKEAIIAAARYLVSCKGRYHTELNFKALAAAIEAHTKAGSGK